MANRTILIPVLATLACVAALLIGGALTRPNLDWYATLGRPAFAPPNDVFPVVWPILYALMAISAWLAWRAPGSSANRTAAATWFSVQLGLGVIWSVAFFSLRSPALGLGVILLHLGSIAITIAKFDRLSRMAAALLVPLFLWVLFAAALNLGIVLVNR